MLGDTLSGSGARLHLLLQAPVVWGRQDAEHFRNPEKCVVS